MAKPNLEEFDRRIAMALNDIFDAEQHTTDDDIRRAFYGVRVRVSELADRQRRQWSSAKRRRTSARPGGGT